MPCTLALPEILCLLTTSRPFVIGNAADPAGAFDPVHCGSTGPDAWHLRYAELHRRILAGEAPQRYAVAHVGVPIVEAVRQAWDICKLSSRSCLCMATGTCMCAFRPWCFDVMNGWEVCRVLKDLLTPLWAQSQFFGLHY